MSLTRQEWLDMWKDIKIIEEDNTICKCEKCRENDPYCDAIIRIKTRIEQVIGQMRTSKEEL